MWKKETLVKMSSFFGEILECFLYQFFKTQFSIFLFQDPFLHFTP